MRGQRVETSRGRALAVLLCLVLGGAGVALTLVNQPATPIAPFDLPWPLLALLYLAAYRFLVDFEFRKVSRSIGLGQLPLALGAVATAPGMHLTARLVATLVMSIVVKRQELIRSVFNVAVSTFEVGAVCFAVALVAPLQVPGPALWLALFAGLLAGELVGNLALAGVWAALDVPLTRDRVLQPLVLGVLTTTVFTSVAIVAVLAVWLEPLSIGVIVALAGGLTLAYRGHRRLSAQQQVTGQLYDFVKDLGPLDITAPGATQALGQVRVLLHARTLDLAVTAGAGSDWQHLIVREDEAPYCEDALPNPALDELTTLRGAKLQRGRETGEADRMVTPLVGSTGLLGILTATERLGDVRSFDMGDLRLMETVATELSTALERGRLLADLERAATTDALTGLPNLSEVGARIDAALAEGDVYVAAVAVDSFREVNDTLGHQVGDSLLVEVSERLALIQGAAIIGRIGGGRFAVAVSAADAGHDPEMFGLSLRHKVEGTAQVGVVGTHIRLSVGVVRAPDHGADAATLLRRAETAMHSAREVHGGPVVWEPAYEVEGQRRLAVVTALREALSTGAIGLAFQPKVDTVTGGVSGVEALARWTHPALGPIAPDEFVPLAEASGLMGALTSTVLRQALVACNGWQRRARHVGVAVNVSADTVLDPSFVTEVAQVLADVGMPAELLTLELTEGVVVADPVLAAERLGELRAIGVKISVDDFGTGYSSLTYLKGLPVDEVKIDKGFVDALVEDAADRAVVRAVVDIAHTLGLRVIAEGVETQDQHEMLRALGVDEAQGYLHARPMPALEVAQWLRAQDALNRV